MLKNENMQEMNIKLAKIELIFWQITDFCTNRKAKWLKLYDGKVPGNNDQNACKCIFSLQYSGESVILIKI